MAVRVMVDAAASRGGGMAAQPYVMRKIPNYRLNHTAVHSTPAERAWRAPNHPQASFLTCSALEDLAAKLNMDPHRRLQQERRVLRHKAAKSIASSAGRRPPS